MKNLFTDYNIPTDLQDNKFVKSLAHQYISRDLSAVQIEVLNDILGVEVEAVEVELKSLNRVVEYFYREDYHGDMLRDNTYAYGEVDLDEKIQDAHAAQYGAEAYINRYKFDKVIEIPSCIDNISHFMIMHYEDFKAINDKVNRNIFRQLKSKNNHLRALKSLTTLDKNGEYRPNDRAIEKCLGSAYHYNR